MASGGWAPPAQGVSCDDDGAEWAFPDADEPVTAANVTVRLPAAALEDLPSLAQVLSMQTCAARAGVRFLEPRSRLILCVAGGVRC
jgi:hypothetical protein